MKVEELMSDLKKNYTVVIVTHNMQQAARISDRTAFFLPVSYTHRWYCFCFSFVLASRAARLMASTSTSSTAPMAQAESKSPSSKARR